MTILDKAKMGGEKPVNESKEKNQKQKADEKATKPDPEIVTDNAQILSAVESQFKNIMQEFQASKGFSVDTGEQPVDTMVELLSLAVLHPLLHQPRLEEGHHPQDWLQQASGNPHELRSERGVAGGDIPRGCRRNQLTTSAITESSFF